MIQFKRMAYPTQLSCLHGQLDLPQYLPDATFGQVRGLSAEAVARCGMQAMMMNTFHLMQKPGASTVKSLGGLHAMSGWERAIFSDSGGFQAYSLIRQDARFGQLNDNGLSFKPANSTRKFQLTPEKCVQLQLSFDSDVLFCLDDCTHIDDDAQQQQISVDRTVRWAERCRIEFDRLLDEKRLPADKRPKLFAVVQGGNSGELRRHCAEALLEIGFDGYGYGGWPLDSQGKLVEEMVFLTRELIPVEFPLHALGIGHPPYVARCTAHGYGLFDSAMPTRDARHGRLYTFNYQPDHTSLMEKNDWFGYIYAHDKRYIKSSRPIEDGCDCPTCQTYSLGYLRHLYKLNDILYQQLSTQHNLHFMVRLMNLIRQNLP
jgi:queuine tRNA-ribosyltransferase